MIKLKTTHANDMVARLLQRFRGKPKLEAFIHLLGRQVQDLENALLGIVAITDLGSVTGVQLDVLGKILQQARNGQDDDTYRLFLRARILVNASQGTVEEVLAVLVLLVPGATLVLTETDPAAFEVAVTSPVPDLADMVVISRLVLEAKSAGIKASIFSYSEPVFRFDTPGGGFGQGNFLSLGVGS